jgi:CheY-like chemotaxis protein
VFTVRVPLAQVEELAASSEIKRETHGASSTAPEGRRVLVVDDNVDGAQTLGEVLSQLGYEIRFAHDGLDALRAAEDFLPHVIVLDIGLPHLSGHEVARRIRCQSWGHDMQLLAVSGWGQKEDIQKSAVAGFNRHFVKPVNIDELAAEIKDFAIANPPGL